MLAKQANAQCEKIQTLLSDKSLILHDTTKFSRNYLSNDTIVKDVIGRLDKINLSKHEKVKDSTASVQLQNRQDKDNTIVGKLISWEVTNVEYSFDRLSNCSVELIQKLRNSDQVQNIIYGVTKKLRSSPQELIIEKKLLTALSTQMELLAKEQEAWYIFASKDREIVKGISISSSNDLFRIAGFVLPEDKEVSKNFFQKNRDMAYTGGLQIEILTDYLKFRGRKNTKTYQRVFFGADVYTPYFKDESIFVDDTSYNLSDRPHASFQYFGYGTSGISYYGIHKWDVNIKLGKIGGGKANSLQTSLHQDLTFSPKPTGWGAQIANPGRLGWSIEYSGEWQLSKNAKSFYWSAPTQLSLGSYMTYAQGGLRLSNRKISSINANYIMAKNDRRKRGIYWSVDVLYSRMIHNTMMLGYGVFRNKEDENDFAEPSKHKLEKGQVNHNLLNLNFTLAKQFKNNAFYYRWSAISPETTFDRTNPMDINGNFDNGVDLRNRWHQWGTLGLVIAFNQ